MLKNIELEKAREILIEKTQATAKEFIKLDNSLNRIIASDLVAKTDIPHFDKSALDGYCLNSKDTEDIHKCEAEFKVIGKIGAGEVFKGEYKKNTAVRIMTGAPIPAGFDCVIRQEDVTKKSDAISIDASLKNNENVVKAGEDIKAGTLILNPGKKVTFEILGMMASLGIGEVEVYKKPKIGIISTGKELLEIKSSLVYGKIYNSNYYVLKGMIEELGGEVINLGITDDSVDSISEKIEKNIDMLDMVITTGGASVGEYDLIHRVYEKLQAEFLFWRVKIKPGTPMLASCYKNKLLVGLSGNPGAALISFEKIVSPAIKKLSGQTCLNTRRVQAILKEDFNKKSSQRRLLRAKFKIENNTNSVYIGEKQNPGALRSLYDCNCLIDIQPGNEGLKAGDTVEIILLKGESFL